METNEEVVSRRYNSNKILGKSPLKFKIDVFAPRYLNARIEELVNTNDITDRVYKILKICSDTSTYHLNGRHQCRSGANRSTGDIWRVYKNYFGEVDIFTIMRALYVLAVEKKLLGTYRCPNVRKRVFWLDDSDYSFATRDVRTPAELGVPLSEWKNIGLNVSTP